MYFNNKVIIASLAVLLLSNSLMCAAQQKPFYCQAPPPQPSMDTTGMTLKMVQILFRHGDRTPLYNPGVGQINEWDCGLSTYLYPSFTEQTEINDSPVQFRRVNMPGRNVWPGNCTNGQLTNLGFAQHLELGQQFRQLYVDQYRLLSPEFNMDEVWVRSTDVYRTFQSLQAQLSGLYPNLQGHGRTVDAIDIHTMDDTYENMTPNDNNCAYLNTLYNNLTSLPAYLQFESETAQLKSTVMSALGVTSFPGWSSFMDYFFANLCHDFPLPSGITEDIVWQTYNASYYSDSYPFHTNQEYGRLAMSTFLEEVVINIQNFIKGANPTKYILFSGHDDSVAPFVNLFGLYNIWPAYASHVEMEIWQDSQADYYLQFKYNGVTYVLPTCPGNMCPMDTFLSLAYSIMVPNYTTICNQN
ncbi:hypothetical protein SAMD00019534_029210 [Acytostelium subglobosum LB1]|uniref:hypothetical protein n=1 Tax=Acytostelium subglobosum LB1 TaxID=1410327 RepID=UPI000644C8C9|nr:hypothetical protein SAMD00019534_029210 [Acytostelium subglobosum LB1]GAM19746.1 hypothetical protein SAMD00019534_029210 [Acytostelium subglobosum LB1]|eukprot:XP_012756508.1 hypothetical protein SAMD00019534_029210 [Acytostelium subglobosum LB1]